MNIFVMKLQIVDIAAKI